MTRAIIVLEMHFWGFEIHAEMNGSVWLAPVSNGNIFVLPVFMCELMRVIIYGTSSIIFMRNKCTTWAVPVRRDYNTGMLKISPVSSSFAS